MTERINYMKCESGRYVGSFVNHPIVVDGDDLEDLKQSCTIMFEAYLKGLQEMIAQPNPFEFKEETPT